MNIDAISRAIELLPVNEQEAFFDELDECRASLTREEAQIDFLKFVHSMWPGFINGRHHKVMARKFEEIASGKIKRLIINMPPRHTKSEFASYMLPAWFLGKYPDKKVIQTSNTADLAVGFGRKVRNLVGSEQYAKIFPNVNLRQDSKAAGRWSTNKDGEYFAIGVGGTVTGKGADLLIIDDPHSEQEAAIAAGDPSVFDKVYEWYTSGPRQRLQPGGSIVVVMTRWAKRDLTGRILQSSIEKDGNDEWEVIDFPRYCPATNLYGLNFGALKNWRLYVLNYQSQNGTLSINKAQPQSRGQLLKESGGRNGRTKTHLGVSSLSRVGIPRS